MPNASPSLFEGYQEFIKKPFELNDSRSFALLQHLLQHPSLLKGSPWSFLINALSGITISPNEALQHWKKILTHKRRLETALRRPVGIKTAVVDYYEQSGISNDPAVETAAAEPRQFGQNYPTVFPASRAAGSSNVLHETVPAPGYHQERLKEEMSRARRYKHALSAIMINVDFSPITMNGSETPMYTKVQSVIDTMIRKAIRNVDIRARHSENLFLLILPNTNKREAQELAVRLLKNISVRMQRLPGVTVTVPLAASVGQCDTKNDTSTEFIMRLEHLIASGKNSRVDAVYLLD
ncbi:MAG: diguanylate cyclase [Chitinispirillaceae bacterium]|nr:diguanylate cyclase [Chitinispirillaceae bacterium]